MALSAIQADSIRRANSRINIWEGSVRASKTVATMHRWIKYALAEDTPEEDLLIVGRTERSIIRNVINPLQTMLGNNCHHSIGKGEFRICDRVCHIIGANDDRAEGKIRGMTAGGALVEEITLLPESFFNMLLSRLSPDNAKLFGSTNPDNPYHYVKKKFIDRADELDCTVFKFLLDNNIFLSDKFIASLKKEYTGLWYKRFIEGLWVMAEGAIFDFFTEDEHVIMRPPGVAKKYYVGADYGTGNPTCFLLIGHNPDLFPAIWCEREYYYDSKAHNRQKDDAEYAEDFIKWIGNTHVDGICLDPSAASFRVALTNRMNKDKRYTPFIDADNSVVDGIRTQARLMNSGKYKVCSACPQTIQDYGAYLWDANAAKRGEDKPIKQNDHTKDPERYVLHTIFSGNRFDYDKLNTR
jgi:PBSX family phage terminase large subunit